MHILAAALLSLVSIITPARTWYPPTQPMNVSVKSDNDAQLVLVDFNGKVIEPKGPTDFKGDKTFDLRAIWPVLNVPGAYVLVEQPKGKTLAQFEGTPLVIEVRASKGDQEVDVAKVMPLEYAIMTTDQGAITFCFYYDVAPLTVESFLNLSRTGYYDGLNFHRIVPGFVIQGGDPRGTGTGGPGYSIPAEFSKRPHLEGVLSMARSQDVNSGGSQFFVCLDYKNTKQLDEKYTTFGQATAGLDVVKKLGATPIADPENGKPVKAPVITKIEVKPVTAAENPYADLLHLK